MVPVPGRITLRSRQKIWYGDLMGTTLLIGQKTKSPSSLELESVLMKRYWSSSEELSFLVLTKQAD